MVVRVSDAWQTQGTPYLFEPISVVGPLTVAGTSADVEMDLEDALEFLEFSISGRIEFRKGNFGPFLDANAFGIAGEDTETVASTLSELAPYAQICKILT